LVKSRNEGFVNGFESAITKTVKIKKSIKKNPVIVINDQFSNFKIGDKKSLPTRIINEEQSSQTENDNRSKIKYLQKQLKEE
jgi:hypothetical protein